MDQRVRKGRSGSASLTVRPAEALDAEPIRGLIFDVMREYGLEPDPEGEDADLASPAEYYTTRNGRFELLVDLEGRIVGTVGLLPLDAEACELRKMYLAKPWRGQGWGKRLLHRSILHARALGYARLILETASSMREAGGLYRAFGFQPTSPRGSRCNRAYVLALAGYRPPALPAVELRDGTPR